jgi:hypothetical protein
LKNKLQLLLKDLRVELGAASELDASARQELLVLAEEIDARVAADEAAVSDAGLNQLEEAAVSFESEHPRVAGVLNSIVDMLGKLGM